MRPFVASVLVMTTFLHRCAHRLRGEHGATDPILVIAAIAVSLILLVGGSFAVAGMINNGKDLNAKSDLDKIAVAEAAASGGGGGYLDFYWPGTGTAADSDLSKDAAGKRLNEQSVGFTPSDGSVIDVTATNSGWIAVVKSSTGKIFYRTSVKSTIHETTNPEDAAADGIGQGYFNITGSPDDLAVY